MRIRTELIATRNSYRLVLILPCLVVDVSPHASAYECAREWTSDCSDVCTRQKLRDGFDFFLLFLSPRARREPGRELRRGRERRESRAEAVKRATKERVDEHRSRNGCSCTRGEILWSLDARVGSGADCPES